MKINLKNQTITMGRGEKALWQATTADGRDIDDAMDRVREAAQALADRLGRTVNVYAPACAGGWMRDQYNPRDR